MRKSKDVAAEREMIRVWSNGLDWPVLGWLVILHVGALACAVLLYMDRAARFLRSLVDDRRPGDLPRLPSPVDPRQFSDV